MILSIKKKKKKVLLQNNVIRTIYEVDTSLFDTSLFATFILTKDICLILNTIYPKIY